MYYKIIGPKFYFRDICPYDIDVLHIPRGTIFTSPYECQGDEYNQDEHWNLDPAYIHFAEGPFNTMLWYYWLFQKKHVQYNQIYKINPMDMIICDRCNDKAGLLQCGSFSIEILEKYDLRTMCDMALKEFYEKKSEFNDIYSQLKLQPVVKALQQRCEKCDIKLR